MKTKDIWVVEYNIGNEDAEVLARWHMSTLARHIQHVHAEMSWPPRTSHWVILGAYSSYDEASRAMEALQLHYHRETYEPYLRRKTERQTDGCDGDRPGYAT